MKKRITLTLALLLALLCCLSACSGGLKTYAPTDAFETPSGVAAPSTWTELPELLDKVLYEYVGDLIYFGDGAGANGIYNIKLGRTVLELGTAMSNVSLYSCGFTVVSEGEITLYGPDGASVATAKSGADISARGEYLLLDHTRIFKLDGDKLVEGAMKVKYMSALPECDFSYGEYYVDVDSDAFTVYDGNFNIKDVVYVPSYAETSYMTMLENGNIFYQYIVELPADAEEYDVFINSDKYELHTFLYNLKKAKLEEIECKYVVRSVINDMVGGFGASIELKKADNLAVATPIVDGNVETDREGYKYYVLSNNGEIKGELKTLVAGTMATLPLGEGLFYSFTYSGDGYLTDKKGNMLAEDPYGEAGIASAMFGSSELKLVLIDDVIYDRKLTVVFDGKESGYSADSSLYTSTGVILMSKYVEGEREYAVYTADGLKPLSRGNLVEADQNMIMLCDTNGTYRVYSLAGVELYSSATCPNFLWTNGDVTLYRVGTSVFALK